ncbi:helix-turn-helix transcriptional regulator [Adlercreutzia sp. R21]|uniref:response regulator transcription factor n=1 Tax=Adlercreutzia wanghongyangiae TaxID=3111451 RepID=UPI002DBB599E|nr:helix-turn-helix transcriptional regulator [Adlercreutzia sp. R21]MEC4183362.1 helix-turn-helix transcriptional regulator [Adlercreutzia sp. R21]
MLAPVLRHAEGDAARKAADAALVRLVEDSAAPASGPSDALTEREREIMAVMADGATVAQAAERLVVSRETVKKHLGNIYSKLGVHSKMQAVALLRDEGVL